MRNSSDQFILLNVDMAVETRLEQESTIIKVPVFWSGVYDSSDRETKLKLYSVQGVSEYWIFEREQQSIEVYRRENGVLKKAMTLFKIDQLTSPLLPGFSCEVGSLYS